MSNYDHNAPFAQLELYQLEQLLQQELEKDLQADPRRVRALWDELDRRQEEHGFADDAGVQAACDRYRQRQKRNTSRKRNWRILATAAAVLLLVVIPPAAKADSMWNALARWSENTFSFFAPVEDAYVFRTEHPGLQQVYDAVVNMGITDPVVPMQIPEEYQLTEFKSAIIPEESRVYAQFTYLDSEIILDIRTLNGGFASKYTKELDGAKLKEIDGISHFIVHNDGKIIVLWLVDEVECSMSVDCQEDVLYEILESIYMTEDV